MSASLNDVAVSEARGVPPTPTSRGVKARAFRTALFVCLLVAMVALGTQIGRAHV